MEKKIRVTCDLSLDSERDKDIIENINDLARSKKLGSLISGLIKYMFDKSERAEKLIDIVTNGRQSVSPNRDKFFQEVRDQVKKMNEKVDGMYKMNLQLLSSYNFGKRLGIEKKTENMMLANFVLEKQLASLARGLGLAVDHVFESDRIKDEEKYADDIVEYIISNYAECAEILSNAELMQRAEVVQPVYVTREPVRAEEPIRNEKEPEVKQEVQPVVQSAVQPAVQPEVKEEPKPAPVSEPQQMTGSILGQDSVEMSLLGDGDIEEFGSADLANFFGSFSDD